jgi:hypothetical protein
VAEEHPSSGPYPTSGPFPYQDPTKLTTDAVNKLQAEIEARLSALQYLFESKLNNVKEVHEEKFRGIEQQFTNSETALSAALKANKDLIDAQNKANTDAADKSEKAFKEQIVSLTTLMNTGLSSLNKSMDERKGATENSTKLLVAVGIVVAIISVFYTIGHSLTAPPPVNVTSPAVTLEAPRAKER